MLMKDVQDGDGSQGLRRGCGEVRDEQCLAMTWSRCSSWLR